ncbi:protein adenylyltransferase SelO [Xylophilus sp. GOD-11R]|uniref:protein adenylyltransferase SelO n=1 Tax=Xylophilus sp. GOD-11R TaxID=3089814 RepID=UPI00298CE64E|nr:YdiU family protein [Xylophilus sp. GOD-11R]WPB59160.1 YdiU family protein [Xylophilus sp. GOD-11R]
MTVETLTPPPVQAELGLSWRPGFATLGPAFSTAIQAQPLPAPYPVGVSASAAALLGLDALALSDPLVIEALAGSRTLAGSSPVATLYSGHQFGVWAGQLGDGRALLLGEVDAPGGPLEIQLKGAGRTPYSRGGDGRAVLRSSIREFLCSEAMAGLGIPTTRALAVVGSDAGVRREEIETAAVVTRLAPSFIRFGHFEHFAARQDVDSLRTLADHIIDRHYPQARAGEGFAGNAYAALLAQVTLRTAAMVAQWQAVGFCHGVMNTDNMSILGLTIDYGPFQFLDGFDPRHICNHSDTQGRYAYDQQPQVAYWNLFCLGQALMPLIGDTELAMAALEPYKQRFPIEYLARMRAKLGLADEQPEDADLLDGLLRLLAAHQVDWTIFWRRLADHVCGGPVEPVRDLFLDREGFDTWIARHAARLAGTDRPAAGLAMLAVNPRFVLRNHLGETAIRQARQKDYSGIAALTTLLSWPFEQHPGFDAYADFPPDWASTIEISCSS